MLDLNRIFKILLKVAFVVEILLDSGYFLITHTLLVGPTTATLSQPLLNPCPKPFRKTPPWKTPALVMNVTTSKQITTRGDGRVCQTPRMY